MMVSIFSNQDFFSWGMCVFFRHNAIAHLKDCTVMSTLYYSVNITFMCTEKSNNSCDSLYWDILLIASLRSACISLEGTKMMRKSPPVTPDWWTAINKAQSSTSVTSGVVVRQKPTMLRQGINWHLECRGRKQTSLGTYWEEKEGHGGFELSSQHSPGGQGRGSHRGSAEALFVTQGVVSRWMLLQASGNVGSSENSDRHWHLNFLTWEL